MKVLILRGAAGPVRVQGKAQGNTRRQRGVLALGNGLGQWVLVNMSPTVAHRLDTDADLASHPGLCDADLRAVVLTDAQVDHVGGLLSLRDGAAIDLYATPTVFEQLTTTLPVLPVLQHYCGVQWRVVPVAGDRRVAPFRVEGLPTLEFTAVATQAPQPPHLARTEPPRVGDSFALAVRDLATGQRLFCAPGVDQLGPAELDWMLDADCLLLDGLGLDEPDPQRPADGAQPPWLAALCGLPARHKLVFCDPGTAEQRSAWADQGIALAHDGLEIEL